MLSTTINDDLHAATNLARSMVTSFGMSPELGMVTIGEQGGEVFLGASLQELGSVGPATLDLIDREVERIVAESVERATHVLRANWATVREIAQVLLDHETVSGLALEALLTPVTLIAVEDVPMNGRRGVSPRARSDRAGAGAELASRAAGAAGRRAVQRGARRARIADVLVAQPRAAGRGGQLGRPARDPGLGRRVLAHAGDGLRRAGRHDADRLGRAGRVLDGQRALAPAPGVGHRALPLRRTARSPAPTRPPTTRPTPTAR